MKYTLQNEIDIGGFSERWACYFVLPINAGEHTRRHKATDDELSMIVGKAFRTLAATMANYKHDAYVRPPTTPPEGWDAKANPEWHYLVEDFNAMIRIVEEVMFLRIPKAVFKIAIMKTQYNTDHYCLLPRGGDLINPDPSLHGPIKKLLPFGS